MNFNILKLVFELTIATPDVSVNFQVEAQTKRPTFDPTFKPTPSTLMYVQDQDSTQSPAVAGSSSASSTTPLPTRPQVPTGSPVERSDISIYNDGGIYTVNNVASSFVDESIVVTKNTNLVLDEGEYLEARLTQIGLQSGKKSLHTLF